MRALTDGWWVCHSSMLCLADLDINTELLKKMLRVFHMIRLSFKYLMWKNELPGLFCHIERILVKLCHKYDRRLADDPLELLKAGNAFLNSAHKWWWHRHPRMTQGGFAMARGSPGVPLSPSCASPSLSGIQKVVFEALLGSPQGKEIL